MMNQITRLLSALRTAYNQQGQVGKILLPVLVLLAFCCLCALSIGLFRPSGPSSEAPSPGILPSPGIEATPTSLFDFDFPTFTPFPTSTSFVSTAFPTLTPPPTESQTPTSVPPTVTVTMTPIPTDTATQVPPSATPIPPTATATRGPVVILTIHRVAENVDIQNIGSADVNLDGWRLVSEAGNQSCTLGGTLRPGRVLKVWAVRGPGYDCELQGEVWMDNGLDAAVLYNPQGEEVSRMP